MTKRGRQPKKEWSFGGFNLQKDGDTYRIYSDKSLIYATDDADKLYAMCRLIEKRGE